MLSAFRRQEPFSPAESPTLRAAPARSAGNEETGKGRTAGTGGPLYSICPAGFPGGRPVAGPGSRVLSLERELPLQCKSKCWPLPAAGAAPASSSWRLAGCKNCRFFSPRSRSSLRKAHAASRFLPGAETFPPDPLHASKPPRPQASTPSLTWLAGRFLPGAVGPLRAAVCRIGPADSSPREARSAVPWCNR